MRKPLTLIQPELIVAWIDPRLESSSEKVEVTNESPNSTTRLTCQRQRLRTPLKLGEYRLNAKLRLGADISAQRLGRRELRAAHPLDLRN